MADLIITNGDSAADLLQRAGRAEPIQPWRDVLHEGPLLAGPLPACSEARVAYLARRFRMPAAEIAAEFAARDGVMAAHAKFAEIELWFEHDLYDQLQLIQALSFFDKERRTDGLILIQADDFLGTQRPDTILRFAEHARPLTEPHLALAAALWADLTAPTPEAIAGRIEKPDDRLPYAASALARFLEELPAPGSGLGRTEQAILDGIAAGVVRPGRLFHAVLAREEAAFMGDLSFFRLLDDLASCDVPLIAGLAPPGTAEDDAERFADAELELTAAGKDVLAGDKDHVALSGLDRWWAGTRLEGRAVWRYDRAEMKLVPPTQPVT
jgi:hypothetical protein